MLKGKLFVTDSVSRRRHTVELTGYVAPQPSLGELKTRATVNFHAVKVGSSKVKRVNLRNVSGQKLAVQLGPIAASGAYTEENNCPALLEAKKKCSVTVTFTPTAVGPSDGALTISYLSGADAPIEQSVALSGAGH